MEKAPDIAPSNPNNSQQPENKNRRKGPIIAGSVVGAAALVTIGAVLAPNLVHNSEKKNTLPPNNDKNSSETATSKPTETEQALSVDGLELSGEMSPEEVGKTLFQDRFTQWTMAGATDANKKAALEYVTKGKGDFNAFSDELAEKNKVVFGDALFTPGWETNPDLIGWVNNLRNLNASRTGLWLKTYKSTNPADKEPYNEKDTVNSVNVNSQTADTLDISVDFTETNNSSENRAVQLFTDPDPDAFKTKEYSSEAVLKLIDGSWKISSLKINALNTY